MILDKKINEKIANELKTLAESIENKVYKDYSLEVEPIEDINKFNELPPAFVGKKIIVTVYF